MTEAHDSPKFAGPLRAVIFDWAGTMIDYGSRAPVMAVMRVFSAYDVPVTSEEARGPMGMAKRDHLRTMLETQRICNRWREVHGQVPAEGSIDKLYASFLETQKGLLVEHTDLIPGCLETLAECRRRGMRIGSTTGYTRELMDLVMPAAREQGLEVEAMQCASDFAEGRPAPWMSFAIARLLGVYPMAAIVKVDDTIVGIEEGLNAGMWTVGVARSGNLVGQSQSELEGLPTAEQSRLVESAQRQLYASGAHFVVDSVATLPTAFDKINEGLRHGVRP